MRKCESRCRLNPIIISEKSKSWVFAVGAKVFKTKFSDINLGEPQTLPKDQMKQQRSIFNQSRTPGALPEGLGQVRENLNFDRFALGHGVGRWSLVNLANGQFRGKTYRGIWIGHVHDRYGVSWVENEPRSGVGLVMTKIGKYQLWPN